LSQIEAAARRSDAGSRSCGNYRSAAKIAELHGDVRRLAMEKQLLATENLALQRARQAEDRLGNPVIEKLQSYGANAAT
jgi:hypothetical protein